MCPPGKCPLAPSDMPSTEPLVIQDYQAEVELQRMEAREEGYVEMNQEADEMVASGEIPDPLTRLHLL